MRLGFGMVFTQVGVASVYCRQRASLNVKRALILRHQQINLESADDADERR